MNDLRLKSIFDLLDKNYFIPSYQRGYRWEKRQIEDLLDDLYAFAKSKKDVESFYCLQPVILKPCDSKTIQENHLNSNIDNNKWYEVIDGQQRLTTIYIIFKYLINKENVTLEDDFKKSLYKISYQTKSDEEQRYIDYPEEYDESTPNACFVTQAYKDIDAWFAKSEAPKKTRGIILNCLTNQKKDEAAEGYVQVIWYELPEEQDPIKTFTRVNIGKIPLTNSELIKALFLQKREKNEIAEVQQIQISKEWDQIEYSLQDKSIWAFLNKDLIDMPAHIDFLFNLMGDLEKERIGVEEFNKKYGTDSFATFRLFNEKFTNATQDTVKNEWEVVREYYDTFMEWYSNSIWYHYIGFLIYCNKPIIDIYKLYKDASKDEFLTSIEEEIKSVFPEAVLRTTFLTGFPGEDDFAASNTKEFLMNIQSAWSGCFPYSREEDTPAYDMKKRVSPKVAQKRADTLCEIQSEITKSFLKSHIGKEYDILIEEIIEGEDGLAIGRAWFQAPDVDGSVVVRYEKDIPEQNDAVQCGRFVRVKIETASDVDLNGLFICDSEKNSSSYDSELKFAPEIQNK